MALFKVGNMMDVFDEATRFIVLLSSQLDHGQAIMSGGVAAQLVAHMPDSELPVLIGEWIEENGGDKGIFGMNKIGKLGMLQERRMHSESMDMHCIGTSLMMLGWQALEKPDWQFHVEQPGQGEPYWLVKDLLERLPDNVTFWSKP